MGRVIVIAFVTLDGVMQDPDGQEGFAQGGWAFRYGPQAVAGDKFRLGEVLDTGMLMLGRRTWQLFSRIWPSNSAILRGDLVDEVQARKQARDVVVVGSASVARALTKHHLVDEYRLLVFPLVLGEGTRLFPGGTAPIDLRLVSAEA